MKKRLAAVVLCLMPSAPMVASEPPVTLESLETQVRTLRRLVLDLLRARSAEELQRCESERDAAAGRARLAAASEEQIERQIAALEDERASPDIEGAEWLDGEVEALASGPLAAAKAERERAESEGEAIARRCEVLRAASPMAIPGMNDRPASSADPASDPPRHILMRSLARPSPREVMDRRAVDAGEGQR
jgi:hypothetical protein